MHLFMLKCCILFCICLKLLSCTPYTCEGRGGDVGYHIMILFPSRFRTCSARSYVQVLHGAASGELKTTQKNLRPHMRR